VAIIDGSDLMNRSWNCRNCSREPNWGKRNCKKCANYYTSEFKDASKIRAIKDRREKREARVNSPKELIDAYNYVRDALNLQGYLPVAESITFRWKSKRATTGLGTCWKDKKLIAVTWKYRDFADRMETYNRQNLLETMLHEALHLRMPHHKKSFKRKEQELITKLRKITGHTGHIEFKTENNEVLEQLKQIVQGAN